MGDPGGGGLRGDPERLRALSLAVGLGPVFVAAIILGYLGGSWLDRRFDWAPWGLVGGLALGMAAGIREVVRVIGRLNDAEAARRERRRAGRSEGGPRPPPGAG